MPDGAKRLPSDLRQLLNNSGFPDVTSPFAQTPITQVGPPNPALLQSPVLASAASSVLKIRGRAPSCSRQLEGTGFVIGPQLVMTNAHVVAGTAETGVEVPGKRGRTTELDARVVLYDAADLAIRRGPTCRPTADLRAVPGNAGDAGLGAIVTPVHAPAGKLGDDPPQWSEHLLHRGDPEATRGAVVLGPNLPAARDRPHGRGRVVAGGTGLTRPASVTVEQVSTPSVRLRSHRKVDRSTARPDATGQPSPQPSPGLAWTDGPSTERCIGGQRSGDRRGSGGATSSSPAPVDRLPITRALDRGSGRSASAMAGDCSTPPCPSLVGGCPSTPPVGRGPIGHGGCGASALSQLA